MKTQLPGYSADSPAALFHIFKVAARVFSGSNCGENTT